MNRLIKSFIIFLLIALVFSSYNSVLAQDTFKSAKIGDQIWMTENLNVDKFKNGELIPEAKTNEEWVKAGNEKQPAWCYYENNSENGKKYGKLYNWYAVYDYRGLAPKGWHIPKKEEFEKLNTTVNKNYELIDKFSALRAGSRTFGVFGDIGISANFWSDSPNDDFSGAYYLSITSIIEIADFPFDIGYSVRCIKD